MGRIECPKCLSMNAWYARDRVDLTLRCLCGYNKVLASLLDLSGVEPVEKIKLKLPVRGSNLLKTLLALSSLVEADSGRIALRMSESGEVFKPKDVASYLYVLKGKGFVVQATVRKRMAGGSLWRVTKEAQDLIQEV
jgi:hypothetical protein